MNLAAARPFIEYPPTPWWYSGLIGGYFAAIAVALFLGVDGHIVAELCVFAGAGAGAGAGVTVGVLFRWYRSRWGTWPQMSKAPPEIRRAYRFALAAVSVALLLTVVVALLSPPLATVAITFLLFTTVFWVYERRVYPAACAAVRSRLA